MSSGLTIKNTDIKNGEKYQYEDSEEEIWDAEFNRLNSLNKLTVREPIENAQSIKEDNDKVLMKSNIISYSEKHEKIHENPLKRRHKSEDENYINSEKGNYIDPKDINPNELEKEISDNESDSLFDLEISSNSEIASNPEKEYDEILSIGSGNHLILNGRLNGIKMEILIDSGSSGDFMHQRIIKKLSFKPIEIKSTPILGFNNKFMFDIY
jgi:hypothetical protein